MADINQKAWKYIYERVMEDNNYSNRIAISDGKSSYSYKQLFNICRKYASVFSALGITKANKSRVGLIGTGSAETIFSFYGLNMTGAEISMISSLSVFKAERIMQVVKDEKLTDLIITDEFIQENTLRKIVQKKDELGLNFIILLHLPMCGCTVPAPFAACFEQKSATTRAFWGPLYMDFLLNVYGRWPVAYDDNESRDAAFIIHTSGTTGGSGSPIVMSDRAFNSMVDTLSHLEGYDELMDAPVTGLMVDLSNAYGIIIQVHFPLALGGKVIIVPGNALNPLFYRAIPHYKISVFFCTAMVFDMWMKYPDIAGFDFSSLRIVILGGTSISAADKKRYREFLMKHGCKDVPILNGYGISELGGVCALSSEDIDDESVGHLMNGFDARFFNEDTEEYLTIDDAPLTGVLYLNSESMTSLLLDGKQLVKTEEIEGKKYVCTNDLMSVDESGNLTYLGRANRYFLHNNGIKYQSGRVETEMSRQAGIENCGIVPVFDKPIHDNVPMLCVTTAGDVDPLEIVKNAMLSVFIKDKKLAIDNVPSILMIAEAFPRNANGKIDLYKLNKGEVEGTKYSIECKKNNGEIIDFTFIEMHERDENIVQKVYKGIAKDMIDESVPGKLHNNMKVSDASFKSVATGPIQSAMMMNYIYQTYCDTMMGWLFQMWDKYKNN